MEQNQEMKVQTNGSLVSLQKEGKSLSVWQGSDKDIWFDSAEEKLVFEIDFSARNIQEYSSYEVFANLMREIVGNYILENESIGYSNLPEDFIDLEKKSITWHSDSGTDNILKLQYKNQKIIVSITKSEKSKASDINRVRIRTSGSNYGYYYQYFLKFHRELVNSMLELNPPKIEKVINNEQPKQKQIEKKFSIFRKNRWFIWDKMRI